MLSYKKNSNTTRIYFNESNIISIWNISHYYVLSYGIIPNFFSIKHSGEVVWRY
jgi:hypothetical protein